MVSIDFDLDIESRPFNEKGIILLKNLSYGTLKATAAQPQHVNKHEGLDPPPGTVAFNPLHHHHLLSVLTINRIHHDPVAFDPPSVTTTFYMWRASMAYPLVSPSPPPSVHILLFRLSEYSIVTPPLLSPSSPANRDSFCFCLSQYSMVNPCYHPHTQQSLHTLLLCCVSIRWPTPPPPPAIPLTNTKVAQLCVHFYVAFHGHDNVWSCYCIRYGKIRYVSDHIFSTFSLSKQGILYSN